MSEEIILIEEDDNGWVNPTPARWEYAWGMIGGNGATGGDFILTKTSIIFKPKRLGGGEETVIPTNKIGKVNSIKVRGRATLEVEYYDGDDNSIGEYKKAHFIVRDIGNWITEIKGISEAPEEWKELEKIDKDAEVDDYCDNGIWDRDGLRDDLKLMREKLGIKVKASPAPKAAAQRKVAKKRKVRKKAKRPAAPPDKNRGTSKMQELRELAEMKKDGLIDDDEFKQLKKEIL